MKKLTKIGEITTEEGKRYEICWDGATLCDVGGEEIMDGAASTEEEARELAANLWSMPCWDYEEA